MNRLMLVLAAALACAPLSANEAPHSGLGLDSDFAAQRAEIEAALVKGDVYKEISPEDRQAVRAALQRMDALLGGVDSFNNLGPADQTQLINGQEQVNQLLTQAADDSVLVCTHEQRLGTKIRESICLTKAERKRANATSRRNADDRLGQLRAQP